MDEIYPQQRRYVLLAIEAELLSEQSVSPYLRDAAVRLSKFWLARAAECGRNGASAEKFSAPHRART
jgi:hypothetical protein